MNFVYRLVETLPVLAWCARLDRGAGAVAVFHGSRVETNPSGFIEGAWNGRFAAFDVEKATIVCGTGAFLNGHGVSFFSSTDRLSLIFSVTVGDVILVSNSPVFLLSMAGLRPHATYPFYTYDLTWISRAGLHCLSGELRTASAEHMRVHFSAVMTIDTQGAIRFDTHPLCEPPRDYTSYAAKLMDGVKQVLRNAGDPARRHSYRPLAAISKGYDAPATALMAREAGCTQAMTFISPGDADPGRDSGSDLAARLGMACTEYDRKAYLLKADLVEAEFCFYATSIRVPLVAAESQLAGSILVTGDWGDLVWDKTKAIIFDWLASARTRIVPGVAGQTEFRLRAGYLAFAPAAIGARHNRDIYRIIVSDEMRPWSVPGYYDRPIPRRMLEEAGIPRASFGMNKYATAVVHLNKRKGFSEASWNSYNDFVRRLAEGDEKTPFIIWKAAAANRHLYWKGLDAASGVFGRKHGTRFVKSSPLQRLLPFTFNARPLPVPWPFGFTFQWSFALLEQRYGVSDDATGNDEAESPTR